MTVISFIPCPDCDFIICKFPKPSKIVMGRIEEENEYGEPTNDPAS